MKKLTSVIICAVLVLSMAVGLSAEPASAASDGDFFVKIGLYYMSTAVAEVTVVSNDGFILAETDRYGFYEIQDLREYTSLRIEYEDGYAAVYDMEDNLVIDSVSQDVALVSAAEDPDRRIVSINGTRYRDGVVAAAYTTGPKLAVANYVTLEHYLWGVVPSEMGYQYGAEALKAQAVCARSFTLANLNKHGGGALSFDLCSKTHCQAYNGVSQEKNSTTNACLETAGEILTYNGKVITAYYHAYNGGYTLDPDDVWSTKLGYLKSSRDEYTSLHTWNTSFTFDELSSILSGYELGRVQAVRVGKRLENGAVQELVIEGSARNVTLSKNMIMSVLNLKSRWFSVLADSYRPVSLPDGTEGTSGAAGSSGQTAEAYYVSSSATGSAQLSASSVLSVVSSSGVSELSAEELVIYNGADYVRPLEGAGAAEDGDTYSGFENEIADNGVVYLSGIGYGHGVGLCQTGANNMAAQGFDYIDIINYYYTDVVIEDLIDAGF